MHGNQFLETIHGTKYRTTDRNTSNVNMEIITSDQCFTTSTKPKVSKPFYTATTNQSNISGPTTKYRTTVTEQHTSHVNNN